MDSTERDRFATLIQNQIAALDDADDAGQMGQKTVMLDQQSVGRLSRQDALLNQSMARATQARRDALRTGLRAALSRLEQGDYGDCDECGDPIPTRRLELDPTVTRCVSCAQG